MACIYEGALSLITVIFFPVVILGINQNVGGRMARGPRLREPRPSARRSPRSAPARAARPPCIMMISQLR